MSPGQTGHITGQMGRVPGTDRHRRDAHQGVSRQKSLCLLVFFFPHQICQKLVAKLKNLHGNYRFSMF